MPTPANPAQLGFDELDNARFRKAALALLVACDALVSELSEAWRKGGIPSDCLSNEVVIDVCNCSEELREAGHVTTDGS